MELSRDAKQVPDAVKLWAALTNRDLSPENPPLKNVQLITSGPSLLTRRLFWLGKKAGPDQVWRRNAPEKKKAAAAAPTADEEEELTAGMATCPELNEECTNLIVLLDAIPDPDVFEIHPEQEWVVVTFTWGRPYSWVGRRLEALETDFGAAKGDVLAARRSVLEHASTPITGPWLAATPAAETIRSWLWSARRPRGHRIYESELVFADDGSFYFRLLGPALEFKKSVKIKDIVKGGVLEVSTIKKKQGREAAPAVLYKWTDIEEVPTLKRAPERKPEQISRAPLLKRKKISEKQSGGGDFSEGNWLAAGGSQKKGALLGEAVSFASKHVADVVSQRSEDAPQQFGPGSQFSQAAGGSSPPQASFSAAASSSAGAGVAVGAASPGAAAASSSAALPKSKHGAGAGAASSAKKKAEEGKPRARRFCAEGTQQLEDFLDVQNRADKMTKVGGGRWVKIAEKVHAKDPDTGKSIVKYIEHRECISLEGPLRQKFHAVRGGLLLKLVGSFPKNTIWPENEKKTKAVPFGVPVCEAFLRTWVRLMSCIVLSSEEFLLKPKKWAVPSNNELQESARLAERLLDHELLELDDADQTKLKKETKSFWEAANFRTCTSFSNKVDLAFLGEAGGN